jgi:DNA sulfur modification protein DndC
MSKYIKMTKDINDLINKGAIFYVSHSGGKDSQSMYAELKKMIPTDQMVVVHADLGEVEWSGVQDHIKNNIDHEMNVVKAGKTFFEMVERRKKFPSSSCRQCTSDLKRDPIMKFIRHDLKAKGKDLAVNCTGIRTQESSARSKKKDLQLNKRETNSVRTVYDWLPIFDMTTDQAFQSIEDAGQKPFWAYEKNERLSCVFCIMGSLNDLRHGAEKNPDLYKKYVQMEKEIGHTMFAKGKNPIPLEEYTGIKVEEVI